MSLTQNGLSSVSGCSRLHGEVGTGVGGPDVEGGDGEGGAQHERTGQFLKFTLEVERAWARAQRPGPNFWLAVNKPQA